LFGKPPKRLKRLKGELTVAGHRIINITEKKFKVPADIGRD
jgi:hypothetical protein